MSYRVKCEVGPYRTGDVLVRGEFARGNEGAIALMAKQQFIIELIAVIEIRVTAFPLSSLAGEAGLGRQVSG